MAIITLNNNSLSSVTSLPAGVGGKVLQVVTNTVQSVAINSGSTYIDVLSTSITPSSSSNKILVTFTNNQSIYGSANQEINYKILRDSTTIESGTAIKWRDDTSGYQAGGAGLSQTILDSPSTTSQVTYKVQMNENSSQEGTATNNHLTLMEISA
jgi:hypothetical protein